MKLRYSTSTLQILDGPAGEKEKSYAEDGGMKTFIVRLLFLLLLLPAMAETEEWGAISGKSVYPVIESGYWIRYPTKIYWVNNESVLFVGGNDPQGGRPANPGKLSLWNFNDSSVRIISEYESSLCFSRGRISYTTRIDRTTATYRVGNFGEEEEKTKLIESSDKDRGIRYNKMSCKRYPESLFPKGANIELIEGHGFLGWEGGGDTPWPVGGEASVRYYKDAATPPIMLPLKRKDIRAPSSAFPPVYAEWANVYVLQGEAEWGRPPTWANFLPKDQPYPVYLIKPGSGEVTTLHAWYQKGVGNWQYFYTKAGLLVFSSAVRGYGLDDAGIYRVVDRGYEKIIKGIPKTGALSPDGCRFAVGMQYIEQKGVRGPIQLKVIDLCKGAK
ncbi:MAG: hypothetical protein H3C26_01910 [Rhodocyclaceae bacterium]|nr:hypothetical protein [Rhodocyclaceae bacterium]